MALCHQTIPITASVVYLHTASIVHIKCYIKFILVSAANYDPENSYQLNFYFDDFQIFL